MPKYTFTVCINRVYFTSTWIFDEAKDAQKELDRYLHITRGNFPNMEIEGYIHLA